MHILEHNAFKIVLGLIIIPMFSCFGIAYLSLLPPNLKKQGPLPLSWPNVVTGMQL